VESLTLCIPGLRKPPRCFLILTGIHFAIGFPNSVYWLPVKGTRCYDYHPRESRNLFQSSSDATEHTLARPNYSLLAGGAPNRGPTYFFSNLRAPPRYPLVSISSVVRRTMFTLEKATSSVFPGNGTRPRHDDRGDLWGRKYTVKRALRRRRGIAVLILSYFATSSFHPALLSRFQGSSWPKVHALTIYANEFGPETGYLHSVAPECCFQLFF